MTSPSAAKVGKPKLTASTVVAATGTVIVAALISLSVVTVLIVIGLLIYDEVTGNDVLVSDSDVPYWFTSTVLLLWGATGIWIGTWMWESREARAAVKSATRDAVDEAGEAFEDALSDPELSKLWQQTRTQLRYYHDLALEQSRRSFLSAQLAAAVGLGVVVTCAALALAADSTPVAVAAGFLGGVGAALAAYIGRTFLAAQRLATQQLRDYFDQPLELSRYVMAERLLAKIDDDQIRQQATAELSRTISGTRSIGVPEGIGK